MGRVDMPKSVRELKAELTVHGVDFSACREKCELEHLLEEACTSSFVAAAATGGYKVESTSNQNDNHTSGIEDGGYAQEEGDQGRRGWVEFVADDEALCHWDDGASGIVPVARLTALPESVLAGLINTFSGSFEDARAAAFFDNRLLVCAIRGGTGTSAEKVERVQRLALASEDVTALVGENAVFWSGGIAELREPHRQLLAPEGAPAIAMVIPLRDAMKVLKTSTTMISKEDMVQAFVEALEVFGEHRDQLEARLVSDDALLRMQQDEEFAATLAADQERAVFAESARDAADAGSVDTAVGDKAVAEALEAAAAAEEAAERLAKKRRLLADDFLAVPPLAEDAKVARLSLRFPTGERIERTFAADEQVERVRQWAECCEFLPEARQRVFGVPKSFGLATAFPRKRLGPEDDSRSLTELGLAPSAALLLLNEDA